MTLLVMILIRWVVLSTWQHQEEVTRELEGMTQSPLRRGVLIVPLVEHQLRSAPCSAGNAEGCPTNDPYETTPSEKDDELTRKQLQKAAHEGQHLLASAIVGTTYLLGSAAFLLVMKIASDGYGASKKRIHLGNHSRQFILCTVYWRFRLLPDCVAPKCI